jgi:hypothetical protein
MALLGLHDEANERKTLTIDVKLRVRMPSRHGHPWIVGEIVVRVPFDPKTLGWPDQQWQYAGELTGEYPDQALFDAERLEVLGLLGVEIQLVT